MDALPRHRARRFVCLFAIGLALGACGGEREPAQAKIDEIDAALATATAAGSGEVAKYLPRQLEDVRDRLTRLRASYDKKDYRAVLSAAPTLARDAQGLAAAARVAKNAESAALEEQWAALSAILPNEVSAIQKRLDQLGKKSAGKPIFGFDLDAAKAGLSNASSLWSKAQAAFAGDNLREAIDTAKTVATQLDSLAAGLHLQLRAGS